MTKYFTVEEANKTLVLVKPIVEDIMSKREKMISLKKLVISMKKDGEDIKVLGEELISLSRQIIHNLEELEQIGCYLKDFQMGIVDFPSILNGRVVFITYYYSDLHINKWHELQEDPMESRKFKYV